MNDDLINRSDLINAKPEFMNEKVVRDTKYRTTKDRIYVKAWNACNSYWLDTIDNAPTVESIKQCKFCKHCGDDDYCSDCHSSHSLFEYHERPQGKWLHNSDHPDNWICSACNCGWDMWRYESKELKYCPNCGAKMTKEVENDI